MYPPEAILNSFSDVANLLHTKAHQQNQVASLEVAAGQGEMGVNRSRHFCFWLSFVYCVTHGRDKRVIRSCWVR
jgi:hypothetical protein